jgi:cell wall-associated NlpC family hydrolase
MKPLSRLAAVFAAGLLVLPQAWAEALPGGAERGHQVIPRALGLVGVVYRSGGSSAATGFDCSGFVGHVFREVMGIALPRSAYDIARTGKPVAKDELKPGDLVFFHTMQNAFSHVGIYLGDHRFVHAPRAGGKVRVEDMRKSYWVTRYNGARRLEKV